MSEENVKTGIFVRIEWQGHWGNVDVADLTNEQFQTYLRERPGSPFTGNVAARLHQWIIEHVDFNQPRWISVEEGFPDDGIEVLAYSPGESDHYGEASGVYQLVFREDGRWGSSESGVWIEEPVITHWRDLDSPKKAGR